MALVASSFPSLLAFDQCGQWQSIQTWDCTLLFYLYGILAFSGGFSLHLRVVHGDLLPAMRNEIPVSVPRHLLAHLWMHGSGLVVLTRSANLRSCHTTWD